MHAHLEAGERRAELVRRRGDELRLQAVDLAQVGDVLEQHHGADQPVVGVAHRRRALSKRALRTVHDERHDGRALFAGDGALRFEHVQHRHRQAGIVRDVLDGPAEHRGLEAKEGLGRPVDPLHASLGVGDDDRVVQRVDRGLGRLLRHQDLAEVGLAKLSDPPGHLVEPRGQHAELVAGPDLDDRVEIARGHARRCLGQLSDRSDDAVRQEDGERDAADDERQRGPERRQKPAARERGRLGGLPPHRILIEGQQPVALPAQLGEDGLELPEVLLDRLPRQGFVAVAATCPSIEQEPIEPRVVVVAGPADRLR